MKHKIIYLLFGALSVAFSIKAQQPSACATPTPEKLLRFDKQTDRESLGAGPYYVQIFVHILRNSDGTNAAMSDANLKTNLQVMANFFQPHNICFVFLGRDFIDNTTWNLAYNSNMIGDMKKVNPHPEAIDIYVHAGLIDGKWGGDAYNIPSGKYSVSATTGFNFSHEMGHCLGLYHTFETSEGCECPNGSNCDSAGDLICDTPADFSGSQNFTDGFCNFIGTQAVPCGPFSTIKYPFDPPVNNIMSYFTGCYTQFTPKQGNRMRNCIDDTGFLRDCLVPFNRTVSGETIADDFYASAQNGLLIGNVGGGGNVYIGSGGHGMLYAGSVVTLTAGTYISPGAADTVVVKIKDLCTGTAIQDESGEDRSNTSVDAGEKPGDALEVSPNPFSGSTALTYRLAETSHVAVRVFNAVGRLVVTLVPGTTQEAGEYRYEFNGEILPTGIYLLHFEQNDRHITKRLVLTR